MTQKEEESLNARFLIWVKGGTITEREFGRRYSLKGKTLSSVWDTINVRDFWEVMSVSIE